MSLISFLLLYHIPGCIAGVRRFVHSLLQDFLSRHTFLCYKVMFNLVLATGLVYALRLSVGLSAIVGALWSVLCTSALCGFAYVELFRIKDLLLYTPVGKRSVYLESYT